MKSQDVLILFKLISLELQARGKRVKKREFAVMQDSEGSVISTVNQWLNSDGDTQAVRLADLEDWRGWHDNEPVEQDNQQSYSVRALASALGLSKTEVSSSLSRCREIGLVFTDNTDGSPLVRKKALLDLDTYSIRYIFPAKPGPIVRGGAGSRAAPASSLCGRMHNRPADHRRIHSGVHSRH
ncbi:MULTISPECIES: hypothetical protein [Pseudomonas]|uniref:hypothetical protein n=1 Tax=Pseudomonas TaxID=286 RepID=UPI001CECAF09|nr:MULTISPECIES: hypothetical protein [Pseudomonas]MCX9154393.1 hypothetical protein [Pseudomonas sp. TB1-B1]